MREKSAKPSNWELIWQGFGNVELKQKSTQSVVQRNNNQPVDFDKVNDGTERTINQKELLMRKSSLEAEVCEVVELRIDLERIWKGWKSSN